MTWSLSDFSNEKKQSVLEEADSKIANVKQRLCQIAQELQGEDPYKYLRAFSPGAQEFIEAILFHHYIKTKKLLPHKELEEQLSFEVIKESEVRGQGKKKQQEAAEEEVSIILIPFHTYAMPSQLPTSNIHQTED